MKKSGLKGGRIPGIHISGTGAVFPSKYGRVWMNEEIHNLKYGAKWKEVFSSHSWDPEYYKKRYGFEKRYWVSVPGKAPEKGEATSADLMEEAARIALEEAKLLPEEIDLLICVSTTSPKYTTSLGAILGGRLGIRSASLEMKAGCSSSIYGMVTAFQFLNSGAEHVLVLAGETLSKVANLDPAVLYSASDGGSAVVLSRDKEKDKGVLSWYLDSDGSHTDAMGVPGILPPRGEVRNEEYQFRYGKIPEEFLREAWKKAGNFWKEDGSPSPDYLIPHQVNRNLIRVAAESAGIQEDNILDLVSEIGNCGSSSILIALDRYRRSSNGENRRILLSAAGGGIAWGGILLQT